MRFCSLNTDCSSLRQGRLFHSYADVVVALMTSPLLLTRYSPIPRPTSAYPWRYPGHLLLGVSHHSPCIG